MRPGPARVPREAPRRGRADRRGADGALSRGRGARSARRRRRAQARRHARRALPGRLLGRLEEPRHARTARPAGRGGPVSAKRGAPFEVEGGRRRRLRLQDGRRPVRREDQSLSRAEGRGHHRHDAPRPSRALEGAHGLAALASRERRPRRCGTAARATSGRWRS